MREEKVASAKNLQKDGIRLFLPKHEIFASLDICLIDTRLLIKYKVMLISEFDYSRVLIPNGEDSLNKILHQIVH